MGANIEIKFLTGGQLSRQWFPPCGILPLEANGICNDAREVCGITVLYQKHL